MKKFQIFKYSLFLLLLQLSILPANAQFLGFNIDGAVAYSESESVSGGSIGVTHPIPVFPNIGATSLSFNKRNTGAANAQGQSITLASRVSINTVNFFYHLPVPFITVTAGFGAGVMEANTKIVQSTNEVNEGTLDDSIVNAGVTEGFARIGYDILPFIELHIGYHIIATNEVDLVEESDVPVFGVTKDKTFSGGLSTIGLQIGF